MYGTAAATPPTRRNWYQALLPALGLRSHPHKSINSINSSMAEPQTSPLQPIPQALGHLVHLNVEFGVLVCLCDSCHCAVSPTALSEHLRTKHSTSCSIQKQIQEYTSAFPKQYNHKIVPLPPNGSCYGPVTDRLSACRLRLRHADGT